MAVRFYDPTTGQFLTRDPITPITRSSCGYTCGNPLNATDPSGLYCISGVAGHDADGNEICNGASEVADNLNPDKNYIAQVWDRKLDKDYGTAFAGSYNFMTGGVRVLTGAGLVYASPGCLVAAPFCAGAGVVLMGWGGLKVRRGIKQWMKYDENPYPPADECTVGDNVIRFIKHVTPWGSGEDIWDRLSGVGP